MKLRLLLTMVALSMTSGGLRYQRGNVAAAELSISEVKEEPLTVDLTGRWVLTLPAGWQRKIEIKKSKDSDLTYHVAGVPSLVMNGVYDLNLDAEQLELVEADNPPSGDKPPVFVWKVWNVNTLTLEFDETHNGASYVGATMSRHFEWDELEENSHVPRIGVLPSRKRVTVTGIAFNDDELGPYVESNDDLYFLERDEPWSEAELGKRVRVAGLLKTRSQVAGPDVLQLKTLLQPWSEVITEEADSPKISK